MRRNQPGTLDTNDDVRVSALRPRPLVEQGPEEPEGFDLPSIGRPPKRRPWVTVAVGVLASVALMAAVGYDQWDRHTVHSGGPVSGGAGINGAPIGVGEPITFGAFVLTNKAKKPALLEDVIVGLTGGFEVLDVRTIPLPSSTTADGQQGNELVGERSDSLTDRHVVPVVTTRGPSSAPHEGLRLIIRARATVPGVARAKGVEFTYRVGHRRYRRSSNDSMYLCAPKDQFPGHSCMGNTEGQFGDAVADFPVR